MSEIRKSSLRSPNNLDSSTLSPDRNLFSPSSASEFTPQKRHAVEKRLVSIRNQINWLTNIKNTLEYQLAHDKNTEN